MAVLLAAMPLDRLVDLVNGWGTTPRREAGEQDCPYPPLHALVGRLGVPVGVEPFDDDAARQVADRLHPVFAQRETTGRVQLVNGLLLDADVRPALHDQPPLIEDRWVADEQRAVLAAAAVALYAYIAAHGADRLGTCNGARCADVYVDASPTRRRRFCSITCQNRARIAAYRRQHKSHP